MAGTKPKKFPLKLDEDFSKDIDNCVFYTNSPSKQQYIIDAVRERVEKDKKKLQSKSIV